MNTGRDGSSGGCRKLTEMVQTWHDVAEHSMYEHQRRLEKLDHWRLTAVYGGQAVITVMLIVIAV